MEYVTLVDQAGKVIGSAEKLAAHRNGGALHLGFSILVFNRRGELLLQQRAAGKYHFALLWSNTCCGHPRPLETPLAAAQRRLGEEFGFTTDLMQVGELSYVADDPVSQLTERERLSVFMGEHDAEPRPNSDEIAAWRWVSLCKLGRELDSAPEEFTPWFRRLVADFSRRGWPDRGQ